MKAAIVNPSTKAIACESPGRRRCEWARMFAASHRHLAGKSIRARTPTVDGILSCHQISMSPLLTAPLQRASMIKSFGESHKQKEENNESQLTDLRM